jgi:hypothetical protein
MTEKATVVIDLLSTCRGFDGWWGNLDKDVQGEIVEAIDGAIQEREPAQQKEILDELDYLRWFHSNADFGPAHTDVVMAMQAEYEKICPVPATWFYE